MVKKGIVLIVLAIVLLVPNTAEAKAIYKYTTQNVSLKDEVKDNIIYRVPRNTKLQIIKTDKKRARVIYKKKRYFVIKKYLSSEQLPGKKKVKKYIKYLHTRGPVNWHGRKYTYYTSKAFPIYKLPVPGIHLDKNGFFCDKNDYIVLGSSRINKANRKIIATPFGKYGKVYDTGGVSTPSWLCDCAVNW